jgi:hypothetical protein
LKSLLNVSDLVWNTAIIDVQLNVQGLPKTQATLANYSDEEAGQLKVELAIDGKPPEAIDRPERGRNYQS